MDVTVLDGLHLKAADPLGALYRWQPSNYINSLSLETPMRRSLWSNRATGTEKIFAKLHPAGDLGRRTQAKSK